MESKMNNWEKQFDNEKLDDDDGNVEFKLEDWEPEGLVVEFEPDEELQMDLDLDEDSVIEFEFEPLPN